MPTSQIDVVAKLKAFPYVSPPSLVTAASEATVTSPDGTEVPLSDLDQFIADLEAGAGSIPSDISDLIGPGAPTPSSVGNDKWESISIADMSWVAKITAPLEKALEKIDKIVQVLTKVLKIIELFNSSFNSFSKLMVSAIDLAQNKLNEFGANTLGFGVYANVLAPPALFKFGRSTESRQQLRGGFEGFLTRLESSVQDTKDANRPQYTTNDYVGGLIVLLDTESIDVIWKGIKQLASMLDFVDLFGLDLSPPPPTNLSGLCGKFAKNEDEDIWETEDDFARADPEHSTKTWEFGVKLEWDQTYTSSGFNVYRSRIPGGTSVLTPYVPTSLVDNKETGEPGLLTIAWDSIINLKAGVPAQLPERLEYLYEDPDFGGPKFVDSPPGSRVTYVDTDMKTKILNPQATTEDQIEIPVYTDASGVEVPVPNYYYVIRACNSSGSGEGDNSRELSVTIKACNDAFSLAKTIGYPNGRFEFISMGYGKLNNWSSIKLTAMIPWFGEVIKILNDFLDTLRGTVTDVSDSFSGFLDQIAEKVTLYSNILGVVSYLVERVKDLLLSPTASFLNVPPEKGGMPVFLQRVRNAQGGDEFSGPNGITVGVVLVYGAGGSNIVQLALMKRAFEFVYSLFVGGEEE